jgi:hypothetical protein
VAAFAVPGESEALILIALGVRQPAPDVRAIDRVEIDARAFTQRGDARGQVATTVDVMVPPGRTETHTDVLSELRLSPGTYAIRVAARSDRLDQTGSVYADVVVPDFARAPLALSGAVVSLAPRPATVSTAARAAAMLPFLPTTVRTITDADRASVFLRVHQGGRTRLEPVMVTALILDEESRTVARKDDTLSTAAFERGRAADYTFVLTSQDLAPGLHLLRIEAAMGTETARREVRFTVSR